MTTMCGQPSKLGLPPLACDDLRVVGAEYLIRPASHDGWLEIHVNSLADVLTPNGFDVQPSPGWGDLHLQGEGYEVSFSGEDAGWQVTLNGDLANLDTDELVAQVARQIEDFTHTATKWVRYT